MEIKNMIILVDMDDVLADFDGEFYRRWNLRHPEKPVVPPEERICFYIKDELSEEYKPLVREINTEKGFIRSLPEIQGGIKAVNELLNMGNEVFICTAPLDSYYNCVLEKYEWVEEHMGFEWTKRLILTKEKALILGDILIDDKPDIKNEHLAKWEQILFDKSYNRHITGKRRLTWYNWKEILLPS
jgi:5'-nucleotidase